MFAGINLQLLQAVQYFKEDDPVAAMMFIIGLGAVILIALIIHLVRHGISISGAGRKTTAASPRRFTGFTLHRIASGYGLNKDQTKFLEFVFRNDAVGDPERVMHNPTLLDRHFKRAYRTIEKSSETEEQLQQQLARLFSLRNIIDAAPVNTAVPAPNQIAENTAAVLSTGKDSYQVKVVSAKADSLIVENPRNSLGTPIQIPRGSKTALSFFTKSSRGFSFECRVAGTVNTAHGAGLQLMHSGNAKALAQRRYRRKAVHSGCVFFFVYVDNVKQGRKKAAKLVVDARRFTGTILDVSIGGCSIKTSAPVQVGSRLKIDMDYSDSSTISVLGQVLRSNRSGAVGTIIHIKFLKVPRRAFNNINTIIYSYDEN